MTCQSFHRKNQTELQPGSLPPNSVGGYEKITHFKPRECGVQQGGIKTRYRNWAAMSAGGISMRCAEVYYKDDLLA